MIRFSRFRFQPVMPLGKNRTLVTGSKAHRAIAAQVAAEGTVLLKNDGALPLAPGAKVCLFGRGAVDYLFGGGGSGFVRTKNTVSLTEALRAAAARGELEFFDSLVPFYAAHRAQEAEAAKALGISLMRYEWQNPRHVPELPEELYQQAKAFGDTAMFCVSRYSAENIDRTGEKGDFYLWEEERRLLDRLTRDFEKVIVILNVCGPVSTREYADDPRISAVLYPMLGGGCSGESVVDILLGKRYPSGHLQDTLAQSIDDYPSTATFRESDDFVRYTEDIFVGYRYFETFCPEKVVYPFGFGLSYTTFRTELLQSALEKNTVRLSILVRNTGNFPGKEVVQAYLTAPQGKLGKAKKVLCAFGKTRELAPGEEAVLQLHFDVREFGSFDDLGKVCKSAFVLEAGDYTVSAGVNVRDVQNVLTFRLEEDVICKKCHGYMAPTALDQRLTADGSYETLPAAVRAQHKPVGCRLKQQAPEQPVSLAEALETDRLDSFLAGMPDADLTELLYGHPVTNASETSGFGLRPREVRFVEKVPLVPVSDGPAGLRMRMDSGIFATWFPCGTVVAQTWNPALARRMGEALAREVKENNVGVWLAPGMNIHRNPLCGRNFEYYSEDPLCTGLIAAAVVQGVQSQKISATVKHFCCNNKETNRQCSDSRVSQRALREIYLRGFEITVKKARPWALMTAYNLINGEPASTNWEAINGILRGEWKYDGLVMTDWGAFSHIHDELHAGSDLKMPELIVDDWAGARADYPLTEMLKTGELDRGAATAAARRILKFMGNLE